MGRWATAPKSLRKPGTKPQLTLADGEFAGRRTINEFDAKRLLAAYGIPVARELRVNTAEEAAQAGEKLGYPVVLKVVSDAIAHKTELGLVAVNLKNTDELAAAFTRLTKTVASLDPYPADVAYLVQEFVADGVEVFAGVSRDPDFGLTLAFGLGGIAIEALKDFSLRMLPLRDGDAEAMIAETRGAALLGPLRGREAADTQNLAACLYALAAFAWSNADRIAEIDLNPIKVLPGRGGCVVVDALIVTRPDSSA
jgi:acetyltransferase